jgi:hypothetical protein
LENHRFGQLRREDILKLLQLLVSYANWRKLVFNLQIDILAVVPSPEHCVRPETRLEHALLVVGHLRVANSCGVVLLRQILLSVQIKLILVFVTMKYS